MRRTTVRRSTLTRLLAAQPRQSNDRSLRDSTGTVRRLRALAWAGFGIGTMQRETGIIASTLSDIRQGRFPRVSHHNAMAIRDAFDRLCLTDGGEARAKRDARRHGWVPAMAWDDIDNPLDRPVGMSRSA